MYVARPIIVTVIVITTIVIILIIMVVVPIAMRLCLGVARLSILPRPFFFNVAGARCTTGAPISREDHGAADVRLPLLHANQRPLVSAPNLDSFHAVYVTYTRNAPKLGAQTWNL